MANGQFTNAVRSRSNKRFLGLKHMIGNAFRHQQAKVLPGVDAYRIAIKRRKSARLVARRWRPSKCRHRNVCSRVQRRRKQTDGYRDIS